MQEGRRHGPNSVRHFVGANLSITLACTRQVRSKHHNTTITLATSAGVDNACDSGYDPVSTVW